MARSYTDNTSDNIVIPANARYGLSTYTVAIWAFPSNTASGGATTDRRVIYKANGTNNATPSLSRRVGSVGLRCRGVGLYGLCCR